jgi:methionyl-tRNA formyltransferase
MILENHNYSIGSLICSKKEMKIATKDGYIQVLNIQFPGKKKMNTAELLNGITFSDEAKAY